MTQSTDRLDRIEALLAENAQQLIETRKITESNARAIEAWGGFIEEVRVDTEEATSSTRADLSVRIEDNAHNQGIDRVRFDALHEEHTQRFNTLLEEARADRAEMRAARDQWQLEAQANSAEHRAFTQNIQVLLAEIARLWQRVG